MKPGAPTTVDDATRVDDLGSDSEQRVALLLGDRWVMETG